MLLLLSSAVALACQPLQFADAEYKSPVIVEARVVSIEEGVATVAVVDTLRSIVGAIEPQLRVLAQEVGFGLSCEPYLGQPLLEVGDRAFLMLVWNEVDERAPWRPYGYYGDGIRVIVGETTWKGRRERKRPAETPAAFREKVRQAMIGLQDPEFVREISNSTAACEAGDAQKCLWLALWLAHDDLEQSTAMLRKACQLGEEEGCLSLGLVMLDAKVRGERMPHRAELMASWVEADCAKGHEASCALKQQALETARGSLPKK